jgi:hypothetical protein
VQIARKHPAPLPSIHQQVYPAGRGRLQGFRVRRYDLVIPLVSSGLFGSRRKSLS